MDDSQGNAFELTPIAIRIPKAARMLGIGRSKFYQLMRSGDVRTIKVGRATLVVVQSLHDFVSRSG